MKRYKEEEGDKSIYEKEFKLIENCYESHFNNIKILKRIISETKKNMKGLTILKSKRRVSNL